MNPEQVTLEIFTQVTNVPRNLGFLSTILIHLYTEIEELVEDQNGMVTHVGSYFVPHVLHIELKPINFTPHLISQGLHQYIAETQFCEILGHHIALDCASLQGCFLLSVDVKMIRRVRFMLPPLVTVPSRAASEDVLQRLVDEQRVESVDLEDEESESSCSICMENLSESSNENVIRMPNCLHMFHQGCIFGWLRLQNTCPLCRRVPYEDDDHKDRVKP